MTTDQAALAVGIDMTVARLASALDADLTTGTFSVQNTDIATMLTTDLAFDAVAGLTAISADTTLVETKLALVAILIVGASHATILLAHQTALTIGIRQAPLAGQRLGIADLTGTTIRIFPTPSTTNPLFTDLTGGAVAVAAASGTGVLFADLAVLAICIHATISGLADTFQA